MAPVSSGVVPEESLSSVVYPPNDDEIVRPEGPLRECIAARSARLEDPKSLFELKTFVEKCFKVRLSTEPLPEHCAGAEEPELSIEPFTVNVGERFGDVISRLGEVSQGRWIFEEVHGVPLLRPNSAVAGHGTLLDTVVSVDIDASSVWEALCALARAVNEANNVHASGARPLTIMFPEAGILRHPAPQFIEEKPIAVSLDRAPAREGLCAIFAQMDKEILIHYYYVCHAEGSRAGHDYVSVQAFDPEGRVVNGGKIRSEEFNHLLNSVDWMSDEDILAVQSPPPDKPVRPR